jgi:hypothetical protein
MDPVSRSKTRSMIKVEPILENAIEIDTYLTKKFDYVIKSDLYKHDNKCYMYDLMRKISLDKSNKLVRPMIVLSPDISISSATLSGSAERHLTRAGVTHKIKGNRVDGMEFSTDLRVLYISSKLSLASQPYGGIMDYQKSILSNALGVTSSSFTNHNVNLDPNNLICIGCHEDLIDQSERALLDSLEAETGKPMLFTLEDIKKKGIDRVMKYVIKRFGSHKVHVVFDMSAISKNIAPSVFRFRSDELLNNSKNTDDMEKEIKGFDSDQITDIMKAVISFNESNNLESFDLTGYSFADQDHREMAHASNMRTSKIMIDILKCVADLSSLKHSINIFDESSKFLIWKRVPTPQTDADVLDDLLGWYILRGIDLETRNDLISHFEKIKLERNADDTNINDDDNKDTDNKDTDNKDTEDVAYPIERFEFPNDDDDEPIEVLISVTSPAEQNLKLHHFATSYADRCLMPGEKVDMVFELLATPSAIKSLNVEDDKLKNADNVDDDESIRLNSQQPDTVFADPAAMAEYNEMYQEYQKQSIQNTNKNID